MSQRILKYQNFTDITPLSISLKLNIALLCLQHDNFEEASKNSSVAIKSATKIKRYDFLMIGLVRHGIATKNNQEINQGISLAEITGEYIYKEGLLDEVNTFRNM